MFCATLSSMVWRITLLGKISATREGKTLSRFESSRAIALLARLALFPNRTHPREELVELLWPEVEPEIGRRRLRHILGTLRQPLELGLPPGSVLIADRLSIRINPDAIATDVAAFERTRDRALYTGELLPGLYDDWIVEERHRLEALAEQLAQPSSGDARADREERGAGLSLPPYLTAFFGREPEREAIAELLTRSRLVTLIGLGGTGKTRLSVEVLREQASCYDKVAFIPLAECATAEQVPGRLRAALGLPATSRDPLAQVCWYLSDSRTLLVLDNLEQLTDSGGGELVEQLLAKLPELTVLVTSRRTLGIAGERLFPLESLPEADALALFLDRVQATRPGFHLTAGNRADVLAVCQGLEGIPLALELAAARIRAFTPAEMHRELDKRFEWLARTGLKGEKDDRHRSLSAALEWSWRLLPAAQQRFLANLALFVAPFTATEAAAVTGYLDARERLEALEADSLIQSALEEQQSETRHTLLETVREFARARLEEVNEARQRFRAAYLAHPTRDENTAMAWEYALTDAQGDDAHAFATLTDADWAGRLGVGRTRSFLERTLELPCTDAARRLRTAYELAACVAREPDRKRAMALMAEAVAPLEALGGEVLAEGLRLQATVGQYEVPQTVTIALLDRCLSLTQDPIRRADALRLKACQYLWTDDFEAAAPLFDEVEALYPPGGRGQRLLLDNRAHLARRREQWEECLRLNRLAAAQARAAGDSELARNCDANLPTTLTHLERWEESLVEARRCVAAEEANGDRFQLLGVLWNMCYPFLQVGESERATKLQAALATIWERDVRPFTDEDIAELNEFRAELTEALGESVFARLWAEGEQLTLKEALALAQATH